jgi:hypothetical protein
MAVCPPDYLFTAHSRALFTHHRYTCLNATCIAVCSGNVTCVDACWRLETSACSGEAVAHRIGGAGNGYNMGATSHNPTGGSTSLTPFEVEVNNTLWVSGTCTQASNK